MPSPLIRGLAKWVQKLSPLWLVFRQPKNKLNNLQIFGCYFRTSGSNWEPRFRWSAWDGVPLVGWKSHWLTTKVNFLWIGALEGVELERQSVSRRNNLKFVSKTHRVYCSIRTIIPGTFQNLKNLEYLYMDSNRVQHIAPSTFYGLNKLKYLGLSKNYLKTLDKVSKIV